MNKNMKYVLGLLCCMAIVGSCTGGAGQKGSNVDSLPQQENIEEKAAVFVFDSTKKYIFLTYDDGPQPGTKECWEVMKSLGVKGTFFMVGQHYDQTPSLRWLTDTFRHSTDYILTNHTYTHANGKYKQFYTNYQGAFADILKAQDAMQVPKKIMRLAGNSAWVLKNDFQASKLVAPTCQLLDKAGYNVIGWDVEWHMKRNPHGKGSIPVESATQMVHAIEHALDNNRTHIKNCVVLLTHDRMFHQPAYRDSLYAFIHTLKTKHPDYIFETVDHLPGIK